jgi:hypothetical protein
MKKRTFECRACPKISCRITIETDYDLGGPYQCPVFNHPAGCKGCKALGNVKDWLAVIE